jgi:hypothetical protein
MSTNITVREVRRLHGYESFRYELVPEGEKDGGFLYNHEQQLGRGTKPRVVLFADFTDEHGWHYHDTHPATLEEAVAFASAEWDRRQHAIDHRRFHLDIDRQKTPFSFRSIFMYACDMITGWEELEEVTGDPEANLKWAARLAAARPWLTLSHAEAAELFFVVAVAGEYAVNNNYDADDEEDQEARQFALNWTTATRELSFFVRFPHVTPVWAGAQPDFYKYTEE